eukprot:TRINITY_DN213_c0_g1_i2.p1 TRINITY_DN213_c0_g1~~TRINITY_DN213_c0_g1_i2.p1  ORF type:complete len:237 (+),score=60.03 TRINITY_DN213_c0_g1_i2:279-989(+)
MGQDDNPHNDPSAYPPQHQYAAAPVTAGGAPVYPYADPHASMAAPAPAGYAPQPQPGYGQPPQPYYGQPPPTVYLQPGQAPPPGAAVYMMPMAAAPQPQVVVVSAPAQPKGPYSGHATAMLILHILALTCGFWVCELPSVAISLHMAAKHVIRKEDRAAVIALSVLELIGLAFFPCFIWYYQYETVCYFSFFGSEYCSIMPVWYGWIAIVVYFIFSLAFGIPRTCLTWRARNNDSH